MLALKEPTGGDRSHGPRLFQQALTTEVCLGQFTHCVVKGKVKNPMERQGNSQCGWPDNLTQRLSRGLIMCPSLWLRLLSLLLPSNLC